MILRRIGLGWAGLGWAYVQAGARTSANAPRTSYVNSDGPVQAVPFERSHSGDPIRVIPFERSHSGDPIRMGPFEWSHPGISTRVFLIEHF